MQNKRWHRVLLPLILVGVLILGIWMSGRTSTTKVEPRVATVRNADVFTMVGVAGALDSARSHAVTSSIKGDKAKIVFLVEEGMEVKPGDTLVQFDPTPFEQEVARLEGELKARDAVVNSYQHLLELEKSQVNNVVAGAEYNRREAKQDESRLQDYVKKIKLIPGGAKTFSTEIDQAEKKLTQQEAKVTKLDADFQQAQKEAVFKIANAMANLEKAKIERETTCSLLDTARGELSKTTVVAPMAGIVVHMEMLRENQKRKPRVGDVIWYNQPILYLPNLSEMLVRTLVRENDLHRVLTGQRASAKVDAFPDLALEGIVKSIGVLASEQAPGRQEGEKYFQVVISLKGSDVRLRPGMSARAFIHGDSAPNTLSVPISSIFPEGGKRFCFVRKGNTFIRREVSVGLEGDELVQIRQGLTEGEQVTLVRPDSWEGR